MSEDNNTKVLVAINAVQNALKIGIPKGQKNAMQGYNFRGIDDIYNVVGPLLPEHGLTILPRMLSWECTERKNAKGNPIFHVIVKAEYRFKATADGSCEVVEMYGEAMDSSDKATNKAMSAAYKYACIQTFSIPVTGEPDADSETHEVAGEAKIVTMPTRPQKTATAAPQRKEMPSTEVKEWRGYLTKVKKHDGAKANGEPYTVYFITMQAGDEVRECATFDEEKFTEAQFWPQEDEVIVKVRPGTKPGKFEFMGLKLVNESEFAESE